MKFPRPRYKNRIENDEIRKAFRSAAGAKEQRRQEALKKLDRSIHAAGHQLNQELV